MALHRCEQRHDALADLMTRAALRSLKKRAYTQKDFERMVAETPFGTAEINAEPMGVETRLAKRT